MSKILTAFCLNQPEVHFSKLNLYCPMQLNCHVLLQTRRCVWPSKFLPLVSALSCSRKSKTGENQFLFLVKTVTDRDQVHKIWRLGLIQVFTIFDISWMDELIYIHSGDQNVFRCFSFSVVHCQIYFSLKELKTSRHTPWLVALMLTRCTHE